MRILLRLSTAMLAGLLFSILWQFPRGPGLGVLGRLHDLLRGPLGSDLALATSSVAINAIPALIVCFVVAALLEDHGPLALKKETYCRRCGHILRAISEPKCPSCGEVL